MVIFTLSFIFYYGKKNNEDEIITNREEILKILDNWD
jgi:hypothetical protein